MKQETAAFKVNTLITTHQNADFDALAATVGAAKLYPEARIVFPGSMNRNVREFVALHGEGLPIVPLRSVDLSSVSRVVVVDTADCSRLGELAGLCGRPGVEVVIFDHHPGAEERPSFVQSENWVLSADGSQASSMVYILLGREIPISPLEASIFALGIHEDTGSLIYPQSTVRDAEMLAVCMRLGASQALIERYLHNPLTPDQRDLLLRVVDEIRTVRIHGHDIFVVALESEAYVDGLSVIAHKVMDLLNCEVLLQAVLMIGRVFVTARSRLGSIDVAALLHTVGGGGHAQAASGVVRNATAHEVIDRLLTVLSETSQALPTAGQIMSRPVHFIQADTTVTEALLVAQRYGHSGIAVEDDGLVGIAARRSGQSRAPRFGARSGQGHHVTERVVAENPPWRSCAASWLTDGGVPVVADAAYAAAKRTGRAHVADVKGIATRTDVLAAFQEPEERRESQAVYQACMLQPLGSCRSSGPSCRRRLLSPSASRECTWWGDSFATSSWGCPMPILISPWKGTGSNSLSCWPRKSVAVCACTRSSARPWCFRRTTCSARLPSGSSKAENRST